MTRVLSQSEHFISVEDVFIIYLSTSQVTQPKLETISMLLKRLPCDEKGLFVLDEPNSITAKSSLLSINN